jgi:hypothetical protein
MIKSGWRQGETGRQLTEEGKEEGKERKMVMEIEVVC